MNSELAALLKPEILVSPDPAAVDEKIKIQIRNLKADAPVTIDAFIIHYKVLYLGYGHFWTDKNGQLDVSRDLCVGGSYAGHVPMGLFTSLRALPSKHAGPRFIVKGPVDEILTYTLTVWKGHLDRHELHRLHVPYILFGTQSPLDGYVRDHFICKTTVRRTYLAPTVRRIEIDKATQEGVPIRGTLFLPKGDGPFPAVIDLFGGLGGCVEFRAALLAKNGFAALALAYFNYKDLPFSSYLDFPMTYFDRAIDWLLALREVDRTVGGVGMIGVSTGSQITLLTAVRNRKLKAAICINANTAMISDPNVEENFALAQSRVSTSKQLVSKSRTDGNWSYWIHPSSVRRWGAPAAQAKIDAHARQRDTDSLWRRRPFRALSGIYHGIDETVQRVREADTNR